MNLILLFKKDFIDNSNKVCLKDYRQKHVLEIHKAALGDKLTVGMENGLIGVGCVTSLDENVLEMDVDLKQDPPSVFDLTLILSLPRPIMLKRVLFSVASLGIKRIYLINSSRVEKSFWNSHLLRDENYKEQLILGLQQSRDTIMPQVILKDKFKPFVEDELPDIIKGTRPFVAHPYASKQCPYNIGSPITLAVGPEGGFIPYEVKKLIECGFTAVHLGERTLHVESAIASLVARLM